MKISSFFALTVASTIAQPSSTFFDLLFGSGEEAAVGGKGVFYLNSQDCFVKVDGTPGSPGDYSVQNANIKPGLVCIGAVCNTGKAEGALAIDMSQGDDDDEKTTFSDEIKLECPTDRFDMQFTCPAYNAMVTVESITCNDENATCTPRIRAISGTVEIDEDGGDQLQHHDSLFATRIRNNQLQHHDSLLTARIRHNHTHQRDSLSITQPLRLKTRTSRSPSGFKHAPYGAPVA